MTEETTTGRQFLEALAEHRAVAANRRPPTAADAVPGAPPVPRHPFIDVALEALARRAATIEPESADDPLCAERQRDRPYWFTRRVATTVRTARPGGVGNPPLLPDLGCLLLAGGLLEVADLERAAEGSRESVAECFGRAIVYRHLADGDLEAATAAAAHPRLASMPEIGWRAIGDHHARRGDAAAFLALWTRYDTRTEKQWIQEARRTLVEQVSRHHGWRDGLAAAHRPRISTAGTRDELIRVALGPLAESVREPELVELLDSAPELAEVGALDRLDLRVRSVRAHGEDRALHTDHPALRPLLDEVIAVDPTTSRNVMRVRDRMLVDLWPAVGTPPTLAELRRALRTPAWKRETAVLHDDIKPPSA